MKKLILTLILLISTQSHSSEMCAGLFEARQLTDEEINQVIVELRELKSQVFVASHHAVASALFKQKLADLTQYLSHAEVQKRMRELEIVKPKETSRKPKKQEKQKITQVMIDDMLLQNLAEAFLLNNKLTLGGKNGEDALSLAMDQNKTDIFEKLIEMGALKDVKAISNSLLEYASLESNPFYLNILLKNPKFEPKRAVAVFHVTILDELTNSAKLFIQAGVNLEAPSLVSVDSRANLATPLMDAISGHSNNGIAKALIDGGANIKALDKKGNDVIYYALMSDNPQQKINFLIKNGVQANQANKKGEGSLHHAMLVDWTPGLISALVRAGADVNLKDLKGNTPLHYLLSTKDLQYRAEYTKALLKEGANPSLKNKKGETPYAIAKRKKLLDVVAVFEKAGITK